MNFSVSIYFIMILLLVAINACDTVDNIGDSSTSGDWLIPGFK